MRTIFFVIALLTIGMACSKKEPLCTSPPPNVMLEIKNVEGLDLLNPNNSGNIKYEDIKLYDIVNNLEVVREVNIVPPQRSEDTYKLFLTLNTNTAQNGISTTILEYEDYSADVITARFRDHDCGVSYSDVWINGKIIISSS